jgi:hypothetical protein
VTVRLSNGHATVTITNDSDNDRNFTVDGNTKEIKKHGGTGTITFDSAGDSTVTVDSSIKTLVVHVLA